MLLACREDMTVAPHILLPLTTGGAATDAERRAVLVVEDMTAPF
jgi:hypothetical protein